MRAIEQKVFPIGRMSQALASGLGRPWRPLSALQPYEVNRELLEERVKMERARASWGTVEGAHADGHDQGRSFFVERSWDDQKSECALWGLAVGAGLYLSGDSRTEFSADAGPACPSPPAGRKKAHL